MLSAPSCLFLTFSYLLVVTRFMLKRNPNQRWAILPCYSFQARPGSHKCTLCGPISSALTTSLLMPSYGRSASMSSSPKLRMGLVSGLRAESWRAAPRRYRQPLGGDITDHLRPVRRPGTGGRSGAPVFRRSPRPPTRQRPRSSAAQNGNGWLRLRQLGQLGQLGQLRPRQLGEQRLQQVGLLRSCGSSEDGWPAPGDDRLSRDP